LGTISVPVLVMAGQHDPRYVALAERTAKGIGDNASCVVVPGAGHSTHLEQPQRFLDALVPWLRREVG
jgi:2-succinyl-6-hydroxy-2,4-cyclohexadiene-1-carboxylate synthase